MAFAVQMFHMTKEVNSTKRPGAAETTFQCVSNADFDIISPRLPLVVPAGANPTAYNYCRVQEFNDRYYWINNWSYEQGLWVAWCEVDALASWKAAIGSTRAYVLRAAADWNSDLIDNLYPTEAGPTVTLTNISTGWWTDTTLDYSQGNFVVGLINEKGATNYVYMTPTQFNLFAQTAFSDTFFNNNVKDQTWLTKAIFDPMQYLSSVTWFPLLFTGGTATTAKLGYWDTGVSCYEAATYSNRVTTTITIPKHPQAATRGKWVNNSPYTTYSLETWPFGKIVLDPALFYDQTQFLLRMTVDYISGTAILRVIAGGSVTGRLVAVETTQLGISVQISQVLRDQFGGMMSVAGGLVGAVGSAVMGNVTGAITGAMSAISGGVEAMYPDVTTHGVNAGFAGLFGQWRLVSKFYSLAGEDLTHRGRPLCEVRTLSTLPGYQLVTDTDLKIPCTKTEMTQIRGYLESGYFYE